MSVLTDNDSIKTRVKALFDEDFVTIDTEFLRERTYYPQLCLIQLAGKDDAFAIDPLADGVDMKPFYKLMQDKKTVKIFHAGSQDIEIIYNLTGKVPVNVFDTQIAASVLGHGESASYAKLVKDVCDVQLDKSSRFTDWAKRPLSQKQVDYAISDVTYLRDIYSQFKAELETLKRHHWLDEEMAILLDKKTYKVDPAESWKRLKIKSHASEDALRSAKALAAWRELKAQEEDVPRSRIIRDDMLVEIAESTPKSVEELSNIRHLHKRVEEKYGAQIVEEVSKGLRARAPKREKKAYKKHASEALVTMLKILLKDRSEKALVSQKMIARVEDLEMFAAMDKSGVAFLKGWRYEVFGRYADELKAGNLAMTARGRNIVLLEKVNDTA